MKKTTCFSLGIIVGLLISHFFNSPITWTDVICISILVIIFSFQKIYEVCVIVFFISEIILLPIKWSQGSFHWYEVLFILWFGYLVYTTVFNKVTTISVNYGDVTRFPVLGELSIVNTIYGRGTIVHVYDPNTFELEIDNKLYLVQSKDII